MYGVKYVTSSTPPTFIPVFGTQYNDMNTIVQANAISDLTPKWNINTSCYFDQCKMIPKIDQMTRIVFLNEEKTQCLVYVPTEIQTFPKID